LDENKTTQQQEIFEEGSLVEKNYYAQKLNSEKLYQVYQTQIDRVKQYLDAEINFVRLQLHGNERVLELGAGYGRIMKKLAPFAELDSVEFGEEYLKAYPNCQLKVMDAHKLELDSDFDVVIVLQNGISAMKGEALNLIRQVMKVLSQNGKAYFSSYSPKFWEHRLAWFHEQANKGLLGEIDLEKTKDGTIVCKDGFVATTYSREDMEKLGQAVGCNYQIQEVDDSSIFLILEK
jgi:SAM-dependent methyltransferase